MKDLILATVHTVLKEPGWSSRLRLDLLLCSLFVDRFFLGDGFVQPFEIVSPKLELRHVPLSDGCL